jgi:membrane-associated phospholipid phosphatase
VLTRLQAEWRLKLLLFVAINAIFWTGYQWLSRHALFPLCEVPDTWLDRTVSFQPGLWSCVYLSQFLFTGTLPLLLLTRADIRRYVISLAVMSVTSFAVFLFFPTEGPRPNAVGDNAAMRWIAAADGPLNALPSLHAAFLVCMGRLAGRMFGLKLAPVVVLWGGAILYSTLATKQHYALDLLAGGTLGWIADSLAWRGIKAAATIPVSSGSASQRGER